MKLYSIALLASSLSALSLACSSGPTEGNVCSPISQPSASECPRTQILDAACSCNEQPFDPSAAGQWACAPTGLVNKDPSPAGPAPEMCNGLDDDGDGVAMDAEACALQCSPAAVETAEDALDLPNGADITTAGGDPGEIGKLTMVPAWCHAPDAPGIGESALWVKCGEIIEVTESEVATSSIRVAPGGVLLVKAQTHLNASEILVCPNGLIQSVPEGPKERGPAIQITAVKWLHYGELRTAGGQLGAVVDKMLLAGLVSTEGASGKPGYTASELDAVSSGDVSFLISSESFLSGTISARGGEGGPQKGCGYGGEAGTSGAISMEMPVCCHGIVYKGGDGNSGGTSASEDQMEGDVQSMGVPWVINGAICDGEDEVEVDVPGCSAVVSLSHEPDLGEDLDLIALDASGQIVDASLGVGELETMTLPGPATYRVLIRAFGPQSSVGSYTLRTE
jgi:hypothetical protein